MIDLKNLNLESLNIPVEDLKELKQGIEQLISNTLPIQSEPEVKILADSISGSGERLTTFELTFWRPILPELNRHRALTQTVRSSRATPTATLIQEIQESPWGPCEWGLNQKGMVADNTVTDPKVALSLNHLWTGAARSACSIASALADAKIHKQIVNRLLEPFSCSHAVVSATEWDNFFELRCASDAQPEMQRLANLMKNAQQDSQPSELSADEWHLPYITAQDLQKYSVQNCCRISAARCARVSYKTYDGSIDPEKDLELYLKLVESKHYSPLEHVATPAQNHYMLSNFIGWNQLRKFEES